jgi:hypothetical protein
MQHACGREYEKRLSSVKFRDFFIDPGLLGEGNIKRNIKHISSAFKY